MLKLLKEAVYSVNKSERRFSSMTTDLKGSCGEVSDLLNTTRLLERFLVSGPIFSQLIRQGH